MGTPDFQSMVGRFIVCILFLMVLVAVMQISYLQPMEGNHASGNSQERLRVEEAKHGGDSLQISPPAMKVSVWDDEDAKLLRLGYVKPQIISWSPRIILLHKFLSDEECNRIMEIGGPKLKVSTVVDAATGKGVKSTVRTSTGMFLTESDRKDPVIQAIERRISVYSMVPIENGELLQVLRYEKGQYYHPHNDFFSDQYNVKRGGQRVATVLMYLTEDVEGGETYFPEANDRNSTCMCGGELKRGVSVKPDRGNAVLFWSMTFDGQTDPRSLHASCPVISGEKWSCTKWLRTGVFQ